MSVDPVLLVPVFVGSILGVSVFADPLPDGSLREDLESNQQELNEKHSINKTASKAKRCIFLITIILYPNQLHLSTDFIAVREDIISQGNRK
jgi:hypothetical protein